MFGKILRQWPPKARVKDKVLRICPVVITSHPTHNPEVIPPTGKDGRIDKTGPTPTRDVVATGMMTSMMEDPGDVDVVGQEF